MESNRYVQLTELGAKRLAAVRRRYGVTVEDIVGDADTPSMNTVKRVLKNEPVFVNTLERVWGYFQRCAADKKERLRDLIEGEDYVFVAGAPGTKPDADCGRASHSETRRGWISRQVPRPNRLFMGRRDLLDRLHAALMAGPGAPLADPQALTGLGGVGKTQTAIAYVYEHRSEYDRIFWASAETVEALNDGLAGMAEELGLLSSGMVTKSAALQRMHDWFRNESGWLLVLDNADDIATLAPHFPRHHAGRLLLTTRTRNTVQWAAPNAVAEFSRPDGALLILRRAGALAVDQTLADAAGETVQAAMELSEELAGLPLALEQAGAYMAETGCTVTDYLARYSKHGLSLLDSAGSGDHTPVAVTYGLALERLAKRSKHGPAAVELVRLCAFLAPDAIPDAIFAGYRFDRDGADSHLDGPDHYREICAVVCGYSLAARNHDTSTLSVHRLVQRVTRDTMEAEERRAWAERAVHAVADATPDFEFEDWPVCERLLPHWRACAEHIREFGIATEQAAYLLYQAGRYLRARAVYGEAEQLLRAAVAMAENVLGPAHSTAGVYLDDLACLCRQLDRRAEAEELHAQAVRIGEAADGPEHLHTAQKLHNLALLHIQCEDYAKAEAVFLRALAIYERQARPDHHLIATTLTQLAGVYRNRGEFDRAEPYCKRALEMHERLFGSDHVDIATDCNNLALLFLTMGRYAEADEFYTRALTINERARGKDHPETGTVAWGLARVRWKLRRADEADALFRRALRIYVTTFGPDHFRAVAIARSYAEFQQEAGRP